MITQEWLSVRDKIINLGCTTDNVHQGTMVYGWGGCSPTVVATSYKHPIQIIEVTRIENPKDR